MRSSPIRAEPGEIITFYSYKGGTGRSMVLANTACLLAQRTDGEGRVLVVDWDLEAPGLHRYFADRFYRRFGDSAAYSIALEGHPGLIDLFIRLSAAINKLPNIPEEPTPEIQEQLKRTVDLDSFILPTDIPNVHLLKAGAFDDDYAKRVNTFPWEPLYRRAPWVITLVADWFTTRFRYTLVDSRTGITDTSGICTMLLPDRLVAVFTLISKVLMVCCRWLSVQLIIAAVPQICAHSQFFRCPPVLNSASQTFANTGAKAQTSVISPDSKRSLRRFGRLISAILKAISMKFKFSTLLPTPMVRK